MSDELSRRRGVRTKKRKRFFVQSLPQTASSVSRTWYEGEADPLELCPETNLKLCLLLALLLKPVFLNNGVAPGMLGGILCRAQALSFIGTRALSTRGSLIRSCRTRCRFFGRGAGVLRGDGVPCRAQVPSLVGTCPLISRCSLLHSCKNRRCSFCSPNDVLRRNGLRRF